MGCCGSKSDAESDSTKLTPAKSSTTAVDTSQLSKSSHLVAQYLKASKDLSRDMKMREEDSTALEQSEALWELNDAAKAAYTPTCVDSGAPSAAPSPALPASTPSAAAAAATRTRATPSPPGSASPPSTCGSGGRPRGTSKGASPTTCTVPLPASAATGPYSFGDKSGRPWRVAPTPGWQL